MVDARICTCQQARSGFRELQSWSRQRKGSRLVLHDSLRGYEGRHVLRMCSKA